MSDTLTPGTRVRHGLTDDPEDVNGNGEVVEQDAWDEDPPAWEPLGTRTRVMWDSGIRDWVHTEDLRVIEESQR